MNHAYKSTESSKAYEQFLESVDGKIFREVIGAAFLARLQGLQHSPTMPLRVLDAGCGDGWLAGLLTQGESFHDSHPRTPLGSLEVHACDAGEPLILLAQKKFPHVQFLVCDLNQPLPYQKNYFDIVTASMVIHDVEDELAALKNLAEVLKPGGKLLASIVNPYYGYPIGEWKRGVIGRLLMKKPSLRLARFYNAMMRQHRPNFEWRTHLGSHFTPLSTHIANASQAGFALTGLEDVHSDNDSPHYNLTYQLHRFPIILLLEFTKL